MALPFMGKKRKSKKNSTLSGILSNKKAVSKKKKEDNAGKSRSQSLGGALVNNLVVKPAKLVGAVAAVGVLKDIPELALLSHAFSSFISDITGVFKSNKIKDEKEHEKTSSYFSENSKLLISLKESITTINDSIIKQSSILDNSFGVLNTRLNTLDDIFAEIRTLTSITAKVWDVSKKSLTNTRSANMTEVIKKKEKNFAAANDKTKNKSAADLDKEEKPIAQSEQKKSGIMDTLGGIGSGIMDIVGKLIEGSGFASLMKMGITALVGTLAAAMGWREIQQMLKTDFGKLGDNISKAFSKDGFMGAVKAFFNDEQVQKLGDALIRGFHDMFDPMLKWVQDAFPEISKGIKAAKKVENGIGTAESIAENVPKTLASGHLFPTMDKVPTDKDYENLSKYVRPELKAWEVTDTQKAKSRNNRSIMDSLFGNDDEDMDLIEAKRKEMGLGPIGSANNLNVTPVSSSRNVANSVAQQQDIATKTEAATTTALQNGSGNGETNGNNSSNMTNNNTNNTSYTVINNGATLRDETRASVTEHKNMH